MTSIQFFLVKGSPEFHTGQEGSSLFDWSLIGFEFSVESKQVITLVMVLVLRRFEIGWLDFGFTNPSENRQSSHFGRKFLMN